MADVKDTLLDNTDTQDNDNTEENKSEKKKKLSLGWCLFIGFLALVAAGIIGLIVWAMCSHVVKTATKKSDDDDDKDKKEGFSASNSISNEYDYVNSVIYATLGDLSGLEKINANAVAA